MMDSPNANASLIPSMSLTMKGGSHFAVYDPTIVISTQVLFQYVFCGYFSYISCLSSHGIKFLSSYRQSELVYCLAIVKSRELNIIGRKSASLHLINFHN